MRDWKNNGKLEYSRHSRRLWYYHPNGERELVGHVKIDPDSHECVGVTYEKGELLRNLDKIDPRMFEMDENELMLTFFKDMRAAYANSEFRWDKPDPIVLPWTGWVYFAMSDGWIEADKSLVRHDIEVACEHQIQVRTKRKNEKSDAVPVDKEKMRELLEFMQTLDES